MHIVGIDLGTTNCVLSSTLNLEEKVSLPSFYLVPLPEESNQPYIGIQAQERGAELPDRVVASAKSWLCYDVIDRREDLLPLGLTIGKKSPLAISSCYLEEIMKQWKEKYPAEEIASHDILITVPASFDPGARELTLEAAEMAGLHSVTLLEEPLAAFYAWLARHEENWRDFLQVGDHVLVIDIGGGTTDFTVISVEDEEGKLTLVRKAVGDHLLLGGDNIDFALAHLAKSKTEEEIGEWQFQGLVHACRKAKEELLSDNPPESVTVTIHGQGSSLVGGTRQIILERDEVFRTLVEGFFPLLEKRESAHSQLRSGIAEKGLPYARDPRITAHLATFLSREDCVPTAVLFNGGTLKAHAFRERLLQQLNQWYSVKELSGADLDFAVSTGAVYYGSVKRGNGIRVKAGVPRSYFIGIEDSVPAIPGMEPSVTPICVVPMGMEEGSEHVLEERSFTLFLNQPVQFRFFYGHEQAQIGEEISGWKKKLTEIHPIETRLDDPNPEIQSVDIQLQAKVTELGMLELWCSGEGNQKWKLEFNLRT